MVVDISVEALRLFVINKYMKILSNVDVLDGDEPTGRDISCDREMVGSESAVMEITDFLIGMERPFW